ncbi:hypothetical protein DFA_02290 [Cavenderia fasciculata]|uniref:G domain-containing protein n=1 Tax=Cavenderia fasciculata TaxID=261658 RepID=F4PZ18_CACFS|nr:uncharacterized protein DFA_02290 [Cavenderia fasciculata]EGG19047.1 hypothetical protein DFA_02290 [Cavenderia fasciculata]|eukprot:XP_004366680.1 hypothetical protein DFA_02290 [Cavenderia fasciculata]
MSSAVTKAEITQIFIVLGLTGVGKSTFINTLTNYFKNGSFPNDIKVSIETKHLKSTEGLSSSELNIHDTTSSQTDECTIYKFNKDGINYEFIDTPGLSDTRGIEQDEININKIIDTVSKVPSLSAIIILINGKDCRDVLSLRNAITRLQGFIPDVILNNLVIVFTKCRKDTCTFDLKLFGDLQSNTTFYMDNSTFSTDPYLWSQDSLRFLNLEFQQSMNTIDRMLQTIQQKATISTQAFTDMQSIRFKVKETLHQSKMKFQRIQQLESDIAEAQQQLGVHSNDAVKFQNYTKSTIVTRKDQIDVDYHNTICSNCDYVCHSHCGLQEISTKGDNAFKKCTAMAGYDYCTVCPGKCSYTVHYHAKKKIKEVTETLEEEIAGMKVKYQQATQGVASAQTQITSISSIKSLVEVAIKSMINVITKSCQELKKICRGFNIVDELYITLQQMKVESRLLTSHEAREAADTMINAIKLLSKSLNENCSTLQHSNDDNNNNEIIMTRIRNDTDNNNYPIYIIFQQIMSIIYYFLGIQSINP